MRVSEKEQIKFGDTKSQTPSSSTPPCPHSTHMCISHVLTFVTYNTTFLISERCIPFYIVISFLQIHCIYFIIPVGHFIHSSTPLSKFVLDNCCLCSCTLFLVHSLWIVRLLSDNRRSTILYSILERGEFILY